MMGKCAWSSSSCAPTHAITRVVVPGTLSNRRGVSVIGAVLPLLALTEKDRRDLDFKLNMGADWVALSFVQRPEDIKEMRDLVAGRANVMAKLEKPSVNDCLTEIVELSDGIMVARGDLGVEMPPETVPVVQRRILRACRKAGKPVIVATQMLESMIATPTPTRAEASDVATAVYGSDAVMLSAESASGSFHWTLCGSLDRIIASVERTRITDKRSTPHIRMPSQLCQTRFAVRCVERPVCLTLPSPSLTLAPATQLCALPANGPHRRYSV